MRSFCEPLSKPKMETRTAAPSNIQGRSLQAMKIPPDSRMRSNTGRLPTMRMELVASSPRALRFARLYLCSRPLKPKRHQVRASRYATLVELAQFVNINIPNSLRIFLPPRNGGLPMMQSASGHSGSTGLPSASWARMASRC